MKFARSNIELMRENKQLQKTNVKFQREKEVMQEMNAETQKRETSHLSEIKRLQGETQRLRNQTNSIYEEMLKLRGKIGGMWKNLPIAFRIMYSMRQI